MITDTEAIPAHGRLHWPKPDELDPEQRTLYDHITTGPRAGATSTSPLTDVAGRLEGPFNAMLLTPELGDALQHLGATLRYRTTLPDRSREIAILTLAANRRSDFEWYAHARAGRRCGLTDAELHALRHDIGCPSFTPDEQLVRQATHALCRIRDLADELYTPLVAALGIKRVNELITLVGYYDLLALSLRVWRTPLPEGQLAPFGE